MTAVLKLLEFGQAVLSRGPLHARVTDYSLFDDPHAGVVMAESTRLCPYCAEEIQAVAIRCKHCKMMLDGSGPATEDGGPCPIEEGRCLSKSCRNRNW
jgi:hypothetical protein